MIKIILWCARGHAGGWWGWVVLCLQVSSFMSALYILIVASIVVAGGFLGAFIWSVRSNQFEDQQGSAMRMLHDNEITENV
ncbi:MAG TPA: cbb3-type cytochrome oxidase assembly protein CcoS [Flavipsychrobacter sp.]|nr:cbb3-type cytochrome oxidase assembly protein CcoS [Flavipsychrobacter sp.]